MQCLSMAAEGDSYFTGPCETPVTIDMVGSSIVDKVGKKTILLKTTGHEKCRYTIALGCMVDSQKLSTGQLTGYREYWRRICAHTWPSPGPRCRARRPVVALASPATHRYPGPHPSSRPDTLATHWTFQHHQDLLPHIVAIRSCFWCWSMVVHLVVERRSWRWCDHRLC